LKVEVEGRNISSKLYTDSKLSDIDKTY